MGKNVIGHYINVIKSVYRDVGNPKRRSPSWPRLEKKFLLNNSKCAFCGSTTNLNVHHKKPFHLYPELELDESNLITLCMSKNECHLKIGHGNNFRLYLPEIDDALSEYKSNQKTLEDIVAFSKQESVKGD